MEYTKKQIESLNAVSILFNNKVIDFYEFKKLRDYIKRKL